MNNTNIKEGQRITFNYYGTVYTRKVHSIYSPIYNPDVISYNVNRIGSGTGLISIQPDDIISVK